MHFDMAEALPGARDNTAVRRPSAARCEPEVARPLAGDPAATAGVARVDEAANVPEEPPFRSWLLPNHQDASSLCLGNRYSRRMLKGRLSLAFNPSKV